VLLVLLGALVSGHGQPVAPGRMTLPGHVPKAAARLASNGRLPATTNLSLAIGLPLRNTAALDEFIRQLYDPASPGFRQFLTPEEFTARFGPTEADYAAVKNFARTNGLAVTATYGNRLVLDVVGPAASVEKAFNLTLRTYRHPTENRDFFAPDAEPSVDASLPIADVSGLSDFVRPFPKSHVMNPIMITPRNGSAPDGSSYFGDDFRNAYVPGTTLTGAGQMVGLVQFDGFYSNDIAAYATAAGGGRTNIVIQTVLLDGYGGGITTNIGNVEVSLDIEMVMAMAPGLSKIVVFEAPNSTAYFNDIFNAMAASNQVKNLSCSWGIGGPNATSENIFKTFAAQGQSFFNASGDSDAFIGAVPFPSESTNITQVGGTTLTTTNSGAFYFSETVWNWNLKGNPGVGSSGGISTYYSIPSWQTGINSFLTNGGSTTMRNIPDVAMTGDNVYVIYGNGSTYSVGGTSCAAPLWAGFMALANQQAAASGKPAVGFINPAVYEIANESIYNSAFNDITTGNNTSSSSPNAFYAGPGYDLCTGVGTPAGTNLINALVNPDPFIVISNAGFNATESAAGTFNITTRTFSLTNASISPLTWSLINNSSWLNVSTNGGTLAVGASSPLVVSLNTVASNLNAGTYTASLWFSNATSGVAHSRFFTLKVNDALVILPTNNFYFIGLPGGPFAPASQSIILTNERAGTLNWSINNTSAWFNVSPASGVLSGGAQTNLSLTLAPAATNLANGIYNATLFVTNTTSQVAQAVTVGVIIGSPVQNGGFETGDFTGWTLTGDAGNFNYVDGSGSFVAPHSGTYCALLGESGYLAYLSQNLPTAVSQKYLLSVWLNNPLAGSFSNPNEFSVSWNGSKLYDKKNIAQTSWTNLQFVVKATATSTPLQIGGRDDPSYLGLDDVSVTPVFAPTISTQPTTNLTILSGSNAVFSAAVKGSTPLIYHWRKNGTNLSNGGSISGATTNVLTFTAVTTNNSGNYTLVITNNYGATTSSVAALTVVLPPTFITAPTNRTVMCGSNVTFTAAASGTPPLNFQWSLDGTGISGATNASFSLANVHPPNHTITVTVTNLYATASSNALLTVQDLTPPQIFTQPQSQTNAIGATANFNVVATACTPLALQWFFNNSPLAGQTNSALTISSLNPSLAGNYFAVATSSGGSTTSSVAVLTVNLFSTSVAIGSSASPSGYTDSINFTAGVTPANASGTIQFLTNNFAFDTETLAAGQAASTNLASLPRGTNLITVIYSGDTNDLPATNTFAQIVTNHPPVAAAFFTNRFAGLGLKISVADLSSNWSDADGDTLSLAATGVSTNGVTVTNNAGTLAYCNSNNVADLFVCTIADGWGGTNFQDINISVVPLPDAAIPSFTGLTPDDSGNLVLNLAGAPGFTYVLETTTNFLFPAGWQPVATNVPGTNGVWQFSDVVTNNPQQFYRLKLVP
jgi:hypothetical protein